VLIIAGSLSFAPSDREDVMASLRAITVLSRKDPGCVDYWWSEDLEMPNTFRFFECWETQELFDTHINAPHEKEFGERNLDRMTGASARIYLATDPPPG
jgi:quinol monooxygenase YgiN